MLEFNYKKNKDGTVDYSAVVANDGSKTEVILASNSLKVISPKGLTTTLSYYSSSGETFVGRPPKGLSLADEKELVEIIGKGLEKLSSGDWRFEEISVPPASRSSSSRER